MRCILLALALVAAGCLGPAAPPPADPPDSDVRSHRESVSLPAGGHHEINIDLEKDASVRFRFEASADVVWNLHSHDADGVMNWQEGRDAAANRTFTAPDAGVYSVFFQNPHGSPVALVVEVEGRFRPAS